MLNGKIKDFGGVENQYIIFKNDRVKYTLIKITLIILWSLKNVQNGIANGKYTLTNLDK